MYPDRTTMLAWKLRFSLCMAALSLFPVHTFAGIWDKDCVVDFYGYREAGTVEGPLTRKLRAGHSLARDRDDKLGKNLYDASVPNEQDDLDALRSFAGSGFSLSPDDCGAPLFAAAFGYKLLLKEFIDRKVDLRSAKFKRGGAHTPLTVASMNGQLETVKLLLERKVALVDEQTETFWSSYFLPFRDGGWTALGLAAQTGQIEVVRYLLGQGASTSKRDGRNYTAIDWARKSGRPDIVLLLESHDKKNAK